MSGALQKFIVASMIMWIAPIVILYGFNHHIFSGSEVLSPSSHTLLSGFLPVIAVNMVIAFYIFMAMKEPTNSEAQPDPKFLAEAKASIYQSASTKRDDPNQILGKDE